MSRTSRHAGCLGVSIAAVVCLITQSPARAAPVAPTSFATCAGCHGAQAEGSAAGAPRLAGQNAQYLERALTMFKAGTRTSPVMQPVASGLAEAEVHELAGYLAGLHSAHVAAQTLPEPGLLAAGQELAQVGAARDPTPPCFNCHGTEGRSDKARFPSLAGQPAAYVIGRLHEFQARARAKPPDPLSMTAVAAHLDERQIRQLAAYLSTLPPP
jgi:cytochrome c553